MKSGPNYAPSNGRSRMSEYGIWLGMISRCTNPNIGKSWALYGGRGIRVCPEWIGKGGFDAFMACIGPRPSMGHTVDRIDVNGHYEPGNVRWATWDVQANNRRPGGRKPGRGPMEKRPGAMPLLASVAYPKTPPPPWKDTEMDALFEEGEFIDTDQHPEQCFGDIQFAPEALRR